MSGSRMLCLCARTVVDKIFTSSKQIKTKVTTVSSCFIDWSQCQEGDVVHLRGQLWTRYYPNNFIKTNSLRNQNKFIKQKFKKQIIKTNHYQMEEICTCVKTAVDRRPFFPLPFPFPPVKQNQDHISDQRIWTKILNSLSLPSCQDKARSCLW